MSLSPKENPTRRPSSTRNGVRHRLRVFVVYLGKRIRITSTLDGKAFVRWEGPQDALSVEESWPDDTILVGGRFNVGGVFHVAKLRMLKGTAKPIE